MMDEAEGAINAFGAALLGDSRRTDRLIEVATALGQRPGTAIPTACDDVAMRKGAYRLCENAAVAPAALRASHIPATWERVAAVPVTLAVRDTTALDFTGQLVTDGLGPLRHGRERGLLAHSTLAVTPQGLPLGLRAPEVWARPQPSKGTGAARGKRPLAERESHTWLTSLAAVGAARDAAPETTIVSVGDREIARRTSTTSSSRSAPPASTCWCARNTTAGSVSPPTSKGTSTCCGPRSPRRLSPASARSPSRVGPAIPPAWRRARCASSRSP